MANQGFGFQLVAFWLLQDGLFLVRMGFTCKCIPSKMPRHGLSLLCACAHKEGKVATPSLQPPLRP